MLPFLDSRKVSSIIRVKHGKSTEMAPEHEAAGGEIHPEYRSAIQDLIQAIDSKSVSGIAKAFEDCSRHCNQRTHDEGPSEQPIEG